MFTQSVIIARGGDVSIAGDEGKERARAMIDFFFAQSRGPRELGRSEGRQGFVNSSPGLAVHDKDEIHEQNTP